MGATGLTKKRSCQGCSYGERLHENDSPKSHNNGFNTINKPASEAAHITVRR